MVDHIKVIRKLLTEENKSVFITGAAGTGKTYTVNGIIEALEEEFEDSGNTMLIGRTAMTGLASQLVEGGQTLHSFMGIPVSSDIVGPKYYPRIVSNVSGYSFTLVDDRSEYNRPMNINSKAISRIAQTEYLIIDEVSMMSDDLFDNVVDLCRRVSDTYSQLQNVLRVPSGNIMDQIEHIINCYNKDSHTFVEDDLMESITSIIYESLNSPHNSHDLLTLDELNEDLERSQAINTVNEDSEKPHMSYKDLEKIWGLPDKDLYRLLNALATKLSSIIQFRNNTQTLLWREAVSNIIMYYDDHDNQCEKWITLREQSKSFSGYIKLILVGDLLQLSPVIKGPEKRFKNYIIYSKYFNEENIVPYILTTNMRQGEDDIEFIECLGMIRRGIINNRVKRLLNSRVIPSQAPLMDYVELRSFNKDVDRINREQLELIDEEFREYRSVDYLIREVPPGEYVVQGKGSFKSIIIDGNEINMLSSMEMFRTYGIHTWFAEGTGGFSNIDDHIHLRVPDIKDNNDIRKAYRNDDMGIVKYKVGAKVILIRNIKLEIDKSRQQFVNGQQGIIVALHDTSVDVMFDDVIANVPRYNFATKVTTHVNTDTPRDYYCMRAQIPLRLGYAITVHKSQGMTLDGAVINLDRHNLYFNPPGQAYVALSRLSSLDGLHIRGPIHYSGIVADTTILSYYAQKSIDTVIYNFNAHKYHLLGLPNPIPRPPSLTDTPTNYSTQSDDIKVKPVGPRRRRALD